MHMCCPLYLSIRVMPYGRRGYAASPQRNDLYTVNATRPLRIFFDMLFSIALLLHRLTVAPIPTSSPSYLMRYACDRARSQHCVATSHRRHLRRRTTHRDYFRCVVLLYDKRMRWNVCVASSHCITVRRRLFDATPQRSVLASPLRHRPTF